MTELDPKYKRFTNSLTKITLFYLLVHAICIRQPFDFTIHVD